MPLIYPADVSITRTRKPQTVIHHRQEYLGSILFAIIKRPGHDLRFGPLIAALRSTGDLYPTDEDRKPCEAALTHIASSSRLQRQSAKRGVDGIYQMPYAPKLFHPGPGSS
jgi:hypothetical protein